MSQLGDVLFHYKHPNYRGCLKKGFKLSDHNYSCGDLLDLYLVVDNKIIKQASFNGQLCAIANYGAELLIEKILGQTIESSLLLTSSDLLPKHSSLLDNPIRLRCFESAIRALASWQNNQ